MSQSIKDVFQFSPDSPEEGGVLLSVAGLRSRSVLYNTELKNLERRLAYKSARGEPTAELTNRLARVGAQNASIEAEVIKQRFFAEGGEGKSAICGQITVAGQGQEGLIVSAYTLDGKPIEPAVRTGASGAFVLVVEPPRPVRIVVSTKDLKVLQCDPTIYDFDGQSKYEVDIRLDTVEPVPIDPEYPCELPPEPDDGGNDTGGDGNNDTGGDDTDTGTGPARETTEVPQLIGLTLPQASERLKLSRLSGDFTTARDPENDGTVIAQGFPAGHKLLVGTAVPVTIAELALGTVPDVRGLPAETAAVRIKEAGFDGSIVTAQNNSTPGVVFDQFPEAGTRAAPGSKVAALVAEEGRDDLLTMPNLSGIPLNDARKRLDTVGLRTGAVSQQRMTSGANGVVLAQSVASGTPVAPNSAIDLTVSNVSDVIVREVPPLIGTVRQSTRALKSIEQTNVTLKVLGDPGRTFRVVSQDPDQGRSLDPAEAVTLTVQPATRWRAAPQEGVAVLFQFAPEWLGARASEALTAKLAKDVAQSTVSDLREISQSDSAEIAEKFEIPNAETAKAFTASIAFGLEMLASQR